MTIDVEAERIRFAQWADSSGVDLVDDEDGEKALMVWLAAKRDAQKGE